MKDQEKLPPKLERLIHDELRPGEILRWQGRSAPRFINRWTFYPFVLGTGLLTFAVCSPHPVFFVIGLFLASVPIRAYFADLRTIYFVTDRRAVSIKCSRTLEIYSYSPEQLTQIMFYQRRGGRGDIIFGRLSRNDREGGDLATNQEIGFFNVRNPLLVKRLLDELGAVANSIESANPPEIQYSSRQLLSLPDPIAAKVREQLESDEIIRWIDRPTPKFFLPTESRLAMGGIVSSVTILVASLFLVDSDQLNGLYLLFLLFFSVSVPIVGVYLLLDLYAWFQERRFLKTVYLITNHRALTLVVGRNTTAYSFPPDALQYTTRSTRAPGFEDVFFSAWGWRRPAVAAAEQVGSFINLRDAKKAERLIWELVETAALNKRQKSDAD